MWRVVIEKGVLFTTVPYDTFFQLGVLKFVARYWCGHARKIYTVLSPVTTEHHGDKNMDNIIAHLDMKGCICHFAKWQIHPFISKWTLWRGRKKGN